MILLYKLSLDILYGCFLGRNVLNKEWPYEFQEWRYVLSTLLLVLMMKPIVRLYSRESISSLVILFMNFMYFIPGLTLYALNPTITNGYFVLFTIYWIVLMSADRLLSKDLFRISFRPRSKGLFYVVALLLAIIALYITGKYNNFRLHFDLIDVYGERAAKAEIASHMPVALNYINTIVAKMVPLVIIYFLIVKKYVWAAFFTVVQFLLFSFGALKGVIFSAFVAYAVYFFFTLKRVHLIGFAFVLINMVSILAYALFDNPYFISLAGNRTFFVPCRLSTNYYDFISYYEPLYLRESILRHFGFESPYDRPLGNIIGEIDYGTDLTYANTGMCGDAYAQFGWFGMFVYPILLVLVFRFLDASAKGLDSRIMCVFAVIFAAVYINGSFFSILLTNGVLFFPLLFMIIPRDGRIGLGKR